MKIVKEIVATTGKYTDHKGAEKNRYQRVGWANLFDPKPREAASAPARHPDAPFDDEVPF